MATGPVTALADTPARQRLLSDLLAWGAPRPPVEPRFAAWLRSSLEEGVAALGPQVEQAAHRSRGGRLIVTKTRLDRLVCDGYALDATPFTWTQASVRGVLGHRAIERDWEAGRTESAPDLVSRIWREVASERPGDPRSLSAWLNTCPPEAATALQADVTDLVAGFREVWPLLPTAYVRARLERRVQIRLARGRVVLQGIPDLVLRSPRQDGRARDLVVDLKTGLPRPEHDRHELRFYALLSTLETGLPPFRWATYYVTEGRAEVEDLRAETLEVTVRRVVDGIAQAVRTTLHDPDQHRLRGGAWCRFCERRPSCPVAPDGDGELPT